MIRQFPDCRQRSATDRARAAGCVIGGCEGACVLANPAECTFAVVDATGNPPLETNAFAHDGSLLRCIVKRTPRMPTMTHSPSTSPRTSNEPGRVDSSHCCLHAISALASFTSGSTILHLRQRIMQA